VIILGKVIPLRRDGYKVEGEAVRIAMKPRRRRWNWRKALGNLLTLAVLASWGVVVYMMFVELAGG
jgi:hypothetical protein